MKHISEIKIGVFVITGLTLLITGWAYLREFAIHEQLSFTVVFNDVVGLTKGSFVRINGLRVGRVDKLTLDATHNKVLVESRIQIPKVTIPRDSMFYIRTSGYVGDKYFDVILGMSNEFIMDGDLLNGEATIDAFQSLEKVSQILNKLDANAVGQSIQDFTIGASSLVKKADSVIENTDKIVKSLPRGNELSILIQNANNAATKLNTAIDKTQYLVNDPSSQNNIKLILEHAKQVSADLNETLRNANSLANNKTAFQDVNNLLLRATKIIEQLDDIRADPLIQNELRETLQNTNVAAKRIAFTSDEVSMALNQRFILPRLLFGKLLPRKKTKDRVHTER